MPEINCRKILNDFIIINNFNSSLLLDKSIIFLHSTIGQNVELHDLYLEICIFPLFNIKIKSVRLKSCNRTDEKMDGMDDILITLLYFHWGNQSEIKLLLVWRTVGKKVIRALAIILRILFWFDCKFLSSHVSYKQCNG